MIPRLNLRPTNQNGAAGFRMFCNMPWETVSLSKLGLTSSGVKSLLPASHFKRVDPNHMTMPHQDHDIDDPAQQKILPAKRPLEQSRQ